MDANFEYFAVDVDELSREEQIHLLRMVAGNEAEAALPYLKLKYLKLVFTFEVPDEQ